MPAYSIYGPGQVPKACFYVQEGRKWLCVNHGKPSKHKVDKHSRFPCLEVDPWTVKELDALHDEAGLYDQWKKSARRRELVEKKDKKKG